MIKALFFDLKGTLLTSAKKLSVKTKSALKVCKGAGIKIFAATARPPLLTKMLNFTQEEEEILQDGGVFYNGGCIYCGNAKLYTVFMDFKAIVRAGRAFSIANPLSFLLPKSIMAAFSKDLQCSSRSRVIFSFLSS